LVLLELTPLVAMMWFRLDGYLLCNKSGISKPRTEGDFRLISPSTIY
jgi:hypothetical protein